MALSRKNRLTSKKDIDKVFKEKSALRGVFLLMRYRKNGQSESRFCFSVPSKIYPKATDRNRIRRILSGTFGRNINKIRRGYDFMVLVVKKGDLDDFKKESEEIIPELV